MEFMQGIVGHVCYIAVVFTAGALIGKPMWSWLCKALPCSDK